MSVELFATAPVLRPLLDEVAERQAAVLRSGRYILGPEVSAFEPFELKVNLEMTRTEAAWPPLGRSIVLAAASRAFGGEPSTAESTK